MNEQLPLQSKESLIAEIKAVEKSMRIIGITPDQIKKIVYLKIKIAIMDGSTLKDAKMAAYQDAIKELEKKIKFLNNTPTFRSMITEFTLSINKLQSSQTDPLDNYFVNLGGFDQQKVEESQSA